MGSTQLASIETFCPPPLPGVFAVGGIVETLWAHNCLFQNVWIFPYIHMKVLKGC